MRRAMLLFVVLVVVTLAVTLPGVAQEEEDPWAVPEEDPWAAEAGCDWYYGYTFRRAGEWEYWCWDPLGGWWYGESEDGKSRIMIL